MTINKYIKINNKVFDVEVKQCVALAVKDMLDKGIPEKKVKRMSIDEKYLYYKNYLDINNRLPEVVKWLGHIDNFDFLCNTKERYDNFMNNFYKERFDKSITYRLLDSLMEFKKYQIEIEKRNAYITIDMIQNLINNNEWDELHEVLNDLSMAGISWYVFARTLKMIENGLTGEEIYNWVKDVGSCNMICFDIEYVKERVNKIA